MPSRRPILPTAPQAELFGPAPSPLPEGWQFCEAFLSVDEETTLLDWLRQQPLEAARYKQYEARRRVLAYGGRYDFDALQLHAAPPLPAELMPLRERIAAWSGVPAALWTDALLAEYAPGTPLGWHRDVPDYEQVAGLSLGGWANMGLRPYPPGPATQADAVTIALPPRSAYLLRGSARWGWQHRIAPTQEWRWSITWRTRREPGR